MRGSHRVLHVDDDREFGALTAELLEREDEQFDVTIVTSASEALDWLSDADSQFDCVVSDYEMPGMDGLDFLVAVREEFPDLPFILFTGKGSEAVASDAIARGATDYLQKGGGTEQYELLANRIRNAIEQYRTKAERERTIERVTDAVMRVDSDWQIRFVDDQAAELYGMDKSELQGENFWDLFSDASGTRFEDAYRRAMVEREQTTIEGETVVLDGWFHIEAYPNDDGGVSFHFHDISERKEHESDLEEIRERMELALEWTDSIIYEIDMETGEQTRHGPFEDIFGLPSEEVPRTESFYRRAVHPEDCERVQKKRMALSEDSNTDAIEVEYRTHPDNGPVRWLRSTSYVRTGTGSVIGLATDVTEQKKYEQQLTRLHEATRGLVGAETPQTVAEIASETADDILGLPLNGVHLYREEEDGLVPVAVSDVAEDLFGDLPVLTRGVAWEVYQRGDPQVYGDIREADEVYNPETPVRSEMFLPLGDHGVFLFSSTDVGDFTEADVTLAKTLAANVESALNRVEREQELERQTERLDEFVSVVSHDLRNPLNTLELSVDLAERSGDGDHFERCRRAIGRMERLIEDLLTLARQGETVSDPEEVHIGDLATGCWVTVETGSANLTVDAETTVLADEVRLKQLFENLFRNAVEHGSTSPDSQTRRDTGRTSSSEPSVADAPEDAVEHGSTSPGSHARQDAHSQPSQSSTEHDSGTVEITVGDIDSEGFYVADDGPGIPEAKREKVFESGYSTNEEGTGFGLAIVQEIAEAHGWSVTVTESAEGGARFEITGVETA